MELHEFAYGNGNIMCFDRNAALGQPASETMIVIVNDRYNQVEFEYDKRSITGAMIGHTISTAENEIEWSNNGWSYKIKHYKTNVHKTTFESTDSTGYTKKITLFANRPIDWSFTM